MQPVIAKSIDDTRAFAHDFIRALEDRPGENAVVVGLYGNLGAGKTTFVQEIAKTLGIKERVTSPTFVIQKSYPVKSSAKFDTLIHIDAYRLTRAEELEKLGFEEVCARKRTLICIEWPEHVNEALPKDMIRIYINIINDEERSFVIKNADTYTHEEEKN